MIEIAYDDLPVRYDLIAAQNGAWHHLGLPGSWWPAHKRVAIAAEARNALGCGLCKQRKEALSPYAIDEGHQGLGALSEMVVDVVHRIVTDPGRLTRRWYESVIGNEFTQAQYVETVGIVATVVIVDTYARGIGHPIPPLPDAETGEPTHYEPGGAGDRGAWVSMIGYDDHQTPENDLFANGPIANIRASLSLVPDEARNFNTLVNHHYMARPIPDDFYETQRR